jgi:hypothetical protein
VFDKLIVAKSEFKTIQTSSGRVGLLSPEGVADLPTKEFLTVQQIAARWKISPDKVRRIFAREPGVLVFVSHSSRVNKRRYSTMRIPSDVLLHVEQKYIVTSASQVLNKYINQGEEHG